MEGVTSRTAMCGLPNGSLPCYTSKSNLKKMKTSGSNRAAKADEFSCRILGENEAGSAERPTKFISITFEVNISGAVHRVLPLRGGVGL
jgi:hypothetical protein